MVENANIVLKSGTVSVSKNAFEGYNGFNVIIPISVSVIYENAFNGDLVKAYCEAKVKPNYWHTNWLGEYSQTNVEWGVDISQILQEL